ncbi:MAG: peptidylprolyl isomerase [Ruminococcaceae bacterium]|nr:peptidylprolyl isomerase [Oscillospiraceae bacterium]
MVQIEMENGGIIKLELYPEAAPITVENFLKLAKEGFYDGLIFHRVIAGFMIQGGDPEGTGMGGAPNKIKGEFSANGVPNPIRHERGVISMARSRANDSASSQFFICHANAPHLNGQYAAFGRVIEGIEVVDEIANVKTNFNDRPLRDVVIKKITVLE